MLAETFYLLDTNIVVYILNGRSEAARREMRAAQRYAQVVVSALTQGELLFGLEKYPNAFRRRSALDEFLASVRVLPWDSVIAPAYGRLRATLATKGKNLATLNMLIAAQAYATGAVLVTHDKAFMPASPQIQIVDWATDLG